VAKDHEFDVAVQILRGAGDQPDQTTRQEVQKSEQRATLPRDKGGSILGTHCPTGAIKGVRARQVVVRFALRGRAPL